MLVLMMMAALAPNPSQEVLWRWDRDSPACSLIQKTDEAQTVHVTRAPGQDLTSISFNVRSPNFWKGLYKGGSVMLSTGETFPATIQVFSGQNRQYILHATVTDVAFTKALANAWKVTVGHRDFGEFSVKLRKVAAATAALRSCEDGRLRDWGIDAGAYWALASRPRPIGDLVDLFNSDNYPTAGVIRAMERNVIAKLEVGADGNVLSCAAPGNFAYPQFVESTCNVLKEGAHFHAAKDASGKAVPAPYVVLVSFRMR